MKTLEYLGVRVAGILFLCWLCESAAGGCSRYGHACWGGHGKRSSQSASGRSVDAMEIIQDRDLEADDNSDIEPPNANVVGGGGYLAELAPLDGEEAGARFEVGRIAPKSITSLLPRAPSENRRENGDDGDVQVFIIPDNAVSQTQKLPSLHIYKILGRTQRKHT